MNKLAPYCSPAMRKMLSDLALGHVVDTRSIIEGAIFSSLQSRGWVDKAGHVTEAGRKYLKANTP